MGGLRRLTSPRCGAWSRSQGNCEGSAARSNELSTAQLLRSTAGRPTQAFRLVGLRCARANKSNRKVIDDEDVSFA